MLKLLFAVILILEVTALKVDENEIFFFFYSSTNSDINTSVPLNRSNWKTAELNTTNDVKVIIHGHGFNHKVALAQSFINVLLLSRKHSNIIFIDWAKYAMIDYFNVCFIKHEIAEVMANDLIEFAKVNQIPLSKFHVIGASYGAQLGGLVGQYIHNKTGSKLTRITGLDPAGPLFFALPESSRLDASDATFVDVIHSSSQSGYVQPCGTIDFWPNGGMFQPGCDRFSNCSHLRAIDYYIESIISKKFAAWECYDEESFNKGLCSEGHCVVMGENVNTTAKGQYHLHTKPESPYACQC